MAIAGTLAACSSGSDADPAPTTDPSTTVAVSEPEPTPTTEAPTTTVAPTTTLDPAESLAAQVEADLLETFRLTDEALLDPTNDEAVAAALDGYVGSNRDLIEARLDDFRSNGYVTRPNPEVEALVIVEKPAVLASSPADTAVIQVCEVDSWIVVEPGAGPDGADAIVDPDVTSYRSNYVLLLVDGRWRIRGSELLAEFPGEPSCPPA
jgi:hypothetical protein